MTDLAHALTSSDELLRRRRMSSGRDSSGDDSVYQMNIVKAEY